jgi:FAD/FMN-containing dehydrogenase
MGPSVEGLRAALQGSVITPEDLGYDLARKVWNADVDRRPAVIAECASAEDVAAAVGFAEDYGLEIAVRAGAHSMPGYSTCDGGLMIDLHQLNSVTVDPDARRVRVGGGALLSDLDAATQAHGLAVPAGVVGHTGVGGLTLGGGMGWLTRQAGLTIDNLLSAQVVLADRRVVRAAEDENPDLFWAIRGGGGNFGVVTEFEFRLHEVGPMIQFGLFFWSVDQGAAALRVIREVLVDMPRTCTAIPAAGLTAPPAPFVPVEHHHEQGYALLLTGFGEPEEHQRLAQRVRSALPPTFEYVSPMPYVALQQMLDEANAWGMYGYDKGAYFAEISDDMIDVLTEYVPRKTSPLSVVLFYPLDGAYSEIGEDDTAFGGGRTPRYMGFFIGLCPSQEMLAGERAWVRSTWDALKPYMIGTGSYVNALEAQEEGRIRDTYGPKYGRLAAIKRKYDPQNVFHRNINIRLPDEAAGD